MKEITDKTGDRTLLLSIQEAADTLRIQRGKLYDLLARGELTGVKIGARRLLPRSEVEAYVARLLEAQPWAGPKPREEDRP